MSWHVCYPCLRSIQLAQKKSDSAAGRQSKRPLRKRHAGDNARSTRNREHPPLIPTFSPTGTTFGSPKGEKEHSGAADDGNARAYTRRHRSVEGRPWDSCKIRRSLPIRIATTARLRSCSIAPCLSARRGALNADLRGAGRLRADGLAARCRSTRRKPVLTQWDAWGNRIDRIELTAAWREGPRITTRMRCSPRAMRPASTHGWKNLPASTCITWPASSIPARWR